MRETVQAELGSEITLRRLRTTYATEFEGDLADAQATLGHTQIKTTMAHYRKAKEERAAASADALESKLSKPESKRTSGHIENKRVG